MIVVDGLVRPFVGRAVGDAALDAAAGEPGGEGERVVVAALGALAAGHAAELGGPDDDRVVEQAGCFKSLIRAAAGRSMLVPMSPWSRAMSSCESQLRRGKPLSAPLQTWTKRTPRSSRRRAIRQLRPKSSVTGLSRP